MHNWEASAFGKLTAKTGLHYHYFFSIKIFFNSNTKPANSSQNHYGCKAIFSTSVESLFLHLKRHTVSRLRLIISMYKFTKKPTTTWFRIHHPQLSLLLIKVSFSYLISLLISLTVKRRKLRISFLHRCAWSSHTYITIVNNRAYRYLN